MNIGFIGGSSVIGTAAAAIRSGRLKARLAVKIDIHSDGRLNAQGMPFFVLNATTHRDVDQRNQARLEVMQRHQVDLIILGAYRREKLSTSLLDAYDGRIVKRCFTPHPEEGGEISGPSITFYGGRKVTGVTLDVICIRRDGDRILAQQPLPFSPEYSEHNLCDLGAAIGGDFFADTLIKIADGDICL